MRKLGLVVLLVLAQSVWAANTWTGAGADNAWGTVDNWDSLSVPTSATDVVIGDSGAYSTIGLPTYPYAAMNTLTINRSSDFGFQTSPTPGDNGYYYPLQLSGTMTLAAGHNYMFDVNVQLLSPTANVIDVGAGSTATFNTRIDVANGFKKVGAGTLNAIGYYGNFTAPAVEVAEGRMNLYYMSVGALTIRSGATMAALGYTDIGLGRNAVDAGNSLIEGTLGDPAVPYRIMKQGTGELRFRGNGVYRTADIGAGAVAARGTIVFDNVDVNNTDRWADNDYYRGWGSVTVKMLGNDNAASSEFLTGGPVGDWKIDVQHGANANASITLDTYAGLGFLTISGNDLNNSTGTNSTVMNNHAWYGYQGETWHNVRVGMEFATVVGDWTPVGGGNIGAYTAARPNDLNATGLTGNSNLLLTSTSPTQLLAAPLTINTLKLDGTVDVDLGTNTLTAGSGLGAGMIKTGTGPSTISNGTLATNSNSILFLTNDADLTLSCTVAASVLAKNGPGLLKLSGKLDNGSGAAMPVRWFDGSLQIDTNQDITLGVGNPDTTTLGSGSLIKNGSGILTLPTDYVNLSTGGATINSGTVLTRSQSPFGSGVTTFNAGTTLDFRQGQINNVVRLAGGQMLLVQYDATFGNQAGIDVPAGKTGTVNFAMVNTNPWYFESTDMKTLTGGGVLNKEGSGRLRFSNGGSFNGTIAVNNGALHVNGNNELPACTVSLASAGKLWISNNVTLTGATIEGTGTIVTNFDPDHTYGYWGNYTATMAGVTLSPGISGVGTLNAQGSLALATNGANYTKLNIDVLGASSFDVLAVSDPTVSNAGNLTGLENADLIVNVAAGLNLKGQMLTIVTCVNDLTLANTFHHVSFTNNYTGTVSYSLGAIVLSDIKLNAIPGDANHSGLVDQDDYKVWYDNYGTGTTWEQGNFKGSGVTDQDDYKTWYDNYGVGTAGGAVPEPATMALLALGGLAMLRRRK